MTQYDNDVERQRLMLQAEEWAVQVSGIHVHSFNSMWYDDRPEDTADGSVTDISYNSGIVVRQKNGETIHTFGEVLTGQKLLEEYVRKN